MSILCSCVLVNKMFVAGVFFIFFFVTVLSVHVRAWKSQTMHIAQYIHPHATARVVVLCNVYFFDIEKGESF